MQEESSRLLEKGRTGMRWTNGDVFIIFGDVARNDGSNIYGVFTNLESAKEEVEYLKEIRPFEEFSIEEHGLWG